MKNFSKNDNSFICQHCGKQVEKLGYSSRNHCPYCLWSLHVDINPGDRANTCKGKMFPKAIDIDSKKGKMIVHKCTKCGKEKRNVCANDDSEALILKVISRG